MHFAASDNNNAEVVKILIENGADINAPDYLGKIPLHYAASDNNNAEVVKILIENGANINAPDYKG